MASWQVDIPGLSRLISSAGAHGLKQLALSSVDVHTIGCMLMIGELVPASQKFRLTLSTRREKQRKESQWLYNVVEIGAGSSFLIDHFLKTRAGENVLALLVSIIPLMSPDACSATLATLFENAGVSIEHTPGLSQFSKLRLALISFARNIGVGIVLAWYCILRAIRLVPRMSYRIVPIIGFQERVLQYQALFERIAKGPNSSRADPFDAIPSESDLPRIILFCHQIATAGDNAPVLVYSGLPGSGWIAAYTSFILGYSVCALDGLGNQIPITDYYSEAKVTLKLAAKEEDCELRTEGHLNDFIRVKPLDQESRLSWSVNCLELDFLAHNLPDIDFSNLVDAIAEIAAVSTMREVAQRARSISIKKHIQPFQTYFESVCPQIQERALDILRILGLETKQRHHYHFRSQPLRQIHFHTAYLADAPFHDLDSEEDVLKALIRRASNNVLHTKLNEISLVLERAILFASQLAFTDWDKGLRTMSAAHFSGHITRREELKRFDPKIRSLGIFEGLLRALLACTNATEKRTLKQRIYTDNWLAINLDGVVMLRVLSSSHSITKIQGMVISLLPGHIIFKEQARESIRATLESMPVERIIDTDPQIRPVDFAPRLQSRFLFSGSGDTLWVSHEILNGPELFTLAHPVEIANAIKKMFVAPPCGHTRNAVLDLNSFGKRKLRTAVEISPGFGSTKKVSRPEIQATRFGLGPLTICYEQVDKNSLAQWLAFQWHTEFGNHPGVILQQDSCLECIIELVTEDEVMVRTMSEDGIICVVSGRTCDLNE